jgi:hypothetical protein
VGTAIIMTPDDEDVRNAPENLVVVCLTAVYGVMMLTVWTRWSGL